jgi:hypothetical protein
LHGVTFALSSRNRACSFASTGSADMLRTPSAMFLYHQRVRQKGVPEVEFHSNGSGKAIIIGHIVLSFDLLTCAHVE